MPNLLLLLIGLFLLIVGAELLVRGASRLATGLGISPLIVGLTVVALGTSSPELAISINGALSGQAGIALGNVLGSNIFNILFILGVSSIIIPLTVSHQLIRFDVPLMIGISLLLLFLVMDQLLSRIDGLILVGGLILYTLALLYLSIRSRPDKTGAANPETSVKSEKFGIFWGKNTLFVLVGLGLLILGSRWFVDSAVRFAEILGVSELIIGLTIVAAGTSMPEVVTSVIAAIRGEREIAVGNVVGSNIFNILCVLGISASIAPFGIEVSDPVIGFDLPIMIAVALACMPVFFTGGIISRWEGSLFLVFYVAYTLYLILNSTQHQMLPLFNTVMLWFIIPLSAITLLVVLFQEWRKRTGNSVT